MTFGEKIKYERKKRKLTQKELAGNKITRNMISLIEKDLANPSLETLKHISEKLDLPLSYLVSDGDDAFFYAKREAFEGIRSAYISKNFPVVVSKIEKLEKLDDELTLMLADSHLEIGKKALLVGSLFTAAKHLKKAVSLCETTCHYTERIRALSQMYLTVSENIQSPLLELDTDNFETAATDAFDVEFYKYLTLDYDFPFKNSLYARHLEAKKLIKEKNYTLAAQILAQIDEENRLGQYNAYMIFGIYSDLEICYKQLCDYKNAYKYSSKRFSMLEGFKI